MSNRIRYWEFWEYIVARLNASTRLLATLKQGKVYLEGQDYSKPEGLENGVWGRVVIVPVTNPWTDQVGIGPTRNLRFLTRCELHSNFDKGLSVQRVLDALQDECQTQLEGVILPVMTYGMGATSLWLARPQQSLPLWDNDRGLYFTSAEWRCELASVT